jgi:hypothetical protein
MYYIIFVYTHFVNKVSARVIFKKINNVYDTTRNIVKQKSRLLETITLYIGFNFNNA